ncbi:hypothetical protein HO133_003294 [Letharia lupina]|uniref:ER membrane protein complex subunit 3 n=1 Tax=Letharia lupina TaxID=560253 RepID=A0A8H6CB97_9LECA|nr:uncharacterized protein HO133_003294 [Letharia lupina]KAF6220163.1 hypothetical protein HO133_003294 [Letharia lupina]
MAVPMVQSIHRDPALFYWILFPISIVMILTGVLRHYATVLLQTTPKKQELPALREQRSLLRGINLRSNSSAIPSTAFASRRQYLVSAYKDGTFLKDPENRGKPAGNPMTDPAAMEGMMGMMKGNMAMMIPQTLIMGWINAFFAGFVITANQMAQQMSQMNPGAGAGMFQPGQDADKMFRSEAENLEVVEHEYILKGVEDRLLA